MKFRFITFSFLCGILLGFCTQLTCTENYENKTLAELINIHNSTNNLSPQLIEEAIATKAANALINGFDSQEDEQAFWKLREDEILFHSFLDQFEFTTLDDLYDTSSPLRTLQKPAFISGQLSSQTNATYGLNYFGSLLARCTPNKIEIYNTRNLFSKPAYSYEFKEKIDASAFKGNSFVIFGLDGTIISVQGNVIRTYNYLSNEKEPRQKICTETPLHVSYDSTKYTVTILLTNGATETWQLKTNITTTALKKFSMPSTIQTYMSDASPVCNKHTLHVAASLNNTVLIYELENPQVLKQGTIKENFKITFDNDVTSLAYSDDGTLFAVGTTDTVYIYNAIDYTLKNTLKIPKISAPETVSRTKIQSITMSHNNRLISIVKTEFPKNKRNNIKKNYSHLFDLTTNTEVNGSSYPSVSISRVHPTFSGNSQYCIRPNGLTSGLEINQVQAPLSVTQYALVKALELNTEKKLNLEKYVSMKLKDGNLKKLFESLPQSIEKHYSCSRSWTIKHWLVLGGIVIIGSACTLSWIRSNSLCLHTNIGAPF